MFTLLACADLYGSKTNLELTFPALPTIGELTRRVEEVFTAEMRAMKPPGAAPIPEGFRVSRLQIYDDVLLKWVDLISSTQLHEYDQIYVFQPQTPWQVDTQQDLPAPRPPTVGTGCGSPTPSTASRSAHPTYPGAGGPPPPPAGGYVPSAGGPSLPMSAYPQTPQTLVASNWAANATSERPNLAPEEKVRIVFEEIDGQRKGFIEYSEMERTFRERGLDFSSNTVGELFYKADLNRDGRVTFDEWANWCQIYPNTLECLYYHAKNTAEEMAIKRQIQAAYDQLQANQAREAQLRRELEALDASNRQLNDDIARGQQAAAEAANRKQTLDPQERELIEEEVKLERQRDQMRMSQARFQEASERFNRESAAKGSPRRARDSIPGY